jgi:hypothetical protein
MQQDIATLLRCWIKGQREIKVPGICCCL